MIRYRYVAMLALLLLAAGFMRSEEKQRAMATTFLATHVTAVQLKTAETSRYMPDQIIVKLRPIPLTKAKQSFGVSSLDQFAQQYGVQSIDEMFPHHAPPVRGRHVDLTRFYVLRYSHPINPFSIAKEFSHRPEVEYAEPWFIYEVDASPPFTPNDTLYPLQWPLKNIKADSAWSLTQGDTTVILAIVDNAVQWDHPDLQPNIWINPGEVGLDAQGHDKRFNGIDDDGDGYIDDWHGWDFAGADFYNPSQDNNPEPTGSNNTHGTHVAGIASAATNNVTGIAGVGFNCRILPIKVGADNDFSGTGGTALILEGFPGIIYAADMGATAINCSWGGTGYSQYEQDVVNYAAEQGSLVIAAAGNGANSDVSYPAGYDNVISVAATNYYDIKTGYSNYGSTIDVCAPGGDAHGTVLSTFYPNTYAYEQGTSQATPHVTGLAGLVKSMFPSYNGLQVGEQIRVTCDDIGGQYYQQLGKGRINALRAITGSSPAIRITSIAIDDSAGGNNNKIPEPNETVNLVITFTNYLQPTTSAAAVTMVTTDTMVQILNGTFPLGTVNMLQSEIASGPAFQIKIKPGAPPDHVVSFTFNISDASYTDYQTINLAINPSYGTQSINNISVTFTHNGRIGFNDFDNNTQGVGFVYAGGNQLYEGGLMIGYSGTKLVDVVRNDVPPTQDNDFLSHNVFAFQTPGTFSDQDGMTTFSDSNASVANVIGLTVNMSSYAFTALADRDYVLLRYDLKNISGGDISNLYAGLFMDWDLLPPGIPSTAYYNNNKTSFDSFRNTGYGWYDTNVTTTYCGARVLTGTAGYYGLNIDSANGTRAMKWAWMTSGTHLMTSRNDIDFVVSSGPYNIPNGSTKTIGFALIGGNGLAAFQAHADAAATKWQNILGSLLGRPQINISIHQNPAFTSYADLYVVSDSQFVAVPSMTIDNGTTTKDTVILSRLDTSLVYKGAYHFTTAGIKTIEVKAMTLGGIDTVVDRSFQAVLAKPGLSQTIQDPERRALITVPTADITEETYFLAYANDAQLSDPRFYPRTYSFGPEKEYASPVAVSVIFTDIAQFKGKERYVHIFRHDVNGWVRLDSWVNLRQKIVQANTSKLGEFALGLDAQSPSSLLPDEFVLYQNYPNPFNPQTKIRYVMPSDGRVSLRIFNLLGQQVQTLVDENQNAGIHEIVWDGKNKEGNQIASGLYVYRLEVTRGNNSLFNSSQKMLLLK